MRLKRRPAERVKKRVRAASRTTTFVRLAGGLLVLGALPSALFADVALTLKDGRVIHASRISDETDAKKIALTKERPRISLTRYFAWSRVRSARIDGTELTAKQLAVRYAVRIPLRRIPLPASQSVPFASDLRSGERQWYSPSMSDLPSRTFYRPLPLESRVLGVRDDPLRTYGETFRRSFPNGVTPNEAGFALEILRTRKAIDVFGASPLARPLPLRLPAPVAPDSRPRP